MIIKIGKTKMYHRSIDAMLIGLFAYMSILFITYRF